MKKVWMVVGVILLVGSIFVIGQELVFSQECTAYSTLLPVRGTGVEIPIRIEECTEIIPCPHRPGDESNCKVWDAIAGSLQEVYGRKKFIKVITEDNVIIGPPEIKYYAQKTIMVKPTEPIKKIVEKEVRYNERIEKGIIERKVGEWQYKEDRKKSK